MEPVVPEVLMGMVEETVEEVVVPDSVEVAGALWAVY